MSQNNSLAAPIGAMVLAAGFSARFKSDKRLARMPDGRTLLETTLSLYVETFTDVLLILSETDAKLSEQVRARLGEPENLSIVLATDASEGMGGSLRAGANYIQALPQNWLMTFIALGDMPYIRTPTLTTLLAHTEALGDSAAGSILAPTSAHKQGHPVGIGKNFLPRLAGCGGEKGARELLQKEADCVHQIRLTDPGIFADIDRPSDLI